MIKFMVFYLSDYNFMRLNTVGCPCSLAASVLDCWIQWRGEFACFLHQARVGGVSDPRNYKRKGARKDSNLCKLHKQPQWICVNAISDFKYWVNSIYSTCIHSPLQPWLFHFVNFWPPFRHFIWFWNYYTSYKAFLSIKQNASVVASTIITTRVTLNNDNTSSTPHYLHGWHAPPRL